MSRRERGCFIHRRRRFPLDEGAPFFIGRDPDCDLYVPAEGVAARHAIVYPAQAGWEIFDFKSATGVVVNGVPVKRLSLKDGDRIVLGEESLVFRSEREEDMSGLRFDVGEIAREEGMDRRLADLGEQIMAAMRSRDEHGAIAAFVKGIFDATGPGAAFAWRFAGEDPAEGDAELLVGGGEEQRKGRQAALLLPCVRKLMRMERILFGGGTPLLPSSWAEGADAKGCFALVPFGREEGRSQALLLLWETGELTCPLSEVFVQVSLLGRFLSLWARRVASQ